MLTNFCLFLDSAPSIHQNNLDNTWSSQVALVLIKNLRQDVFSAFLIVEQTVGINISFSLNWGAQ